MSQLPSGDYACDRCGASVANGGALESVTIVTTRKGADGFHLPVRFDLCRDRPDPMDPEQITKGCEDRVLTRAALRSYHERQQT